MQRAFLTWLIVLGNIGVATDALSAELKSARQLKGTYLLSGSGTCVDATDFPAPQSPKGIREIEYIATHGTRTFNEDGTGWEATRSRVIVFNPSTSTAVVSTDEIGYSFSYFASSSDLVWESSPLGDITGQKDGVRFTISGFPQLFGGISQDGTKLEAVTDQQPMIEYVTYVDGNTLKRVCERSFVYSLQQ